LSKGFTRQARKSLRELADLRPPFLEKGVRSLRLAFCKAITF